MFVESNETNIGVTGIGAPILDVNNAIVATIGVIRPKFQLNNKIDEIKKLTMETSKKISYRMGYKQGE